jgi:hypothetical protein
VFLTEQTVQKFHFKIPTSFKKNIAFNIKKFILKIINHLPCYKSNNEGGEDETAFYLGINLVLCGQSFGYPEPCGNNGG